MNNTTATDAAPDAAAPAAAAEPAPVLAAADASVETGPVRYELDGKVAHLVMQERPHNFLGLALIEGLIEGTRRAQADGARAVVVRSGLRNFCAGADVGLFETADRGEAPNVDITEILRAFDELPMPVLASVHGVCVGGGLELALACDLIIAAESAKLGSVEATIGMNPLMGAMQRVAQRAGVTRAKEMAMLARRYDARTLERWNIINRVVPDDQLLDATHVLAQELANGPTVAHASTKRILAVAVNDGVRAADDAMGELQQELWGSSDLQEGLRSLMVNGPGAARFEGK
jgi:enoyl-CoA hydratase/carnithine racemase